jgi:hypothetical protein
MMALSISFQRMNQQRLTTTPFERPEDVVSWFGAVQAQDYSGAKWALGLRLLDATDTVIEAACNAGKILRTHIMRPTWHFVTPADLRWLMALTAPRILSATASMYRKLELDAALLARSNTVIAKVLEGGHALTRAELGKALEAAGISTTGLRLTFMVGRAEIDALICSGPRHGKQFTYALLDERAPQGRRLQRDEALAELTHRYFTAHSPATLRDFAWWSGLAMSDAKKGVELVAGDLNHEVIDGQPYWFSAASLPDTANAHSAYLLPAYDEFLVGYSASDNSRHAGPHTEENLVFESTILMGGQIVGRWRRTFDQGAVNLNWSAFRAFTAAERSVIIASVERYGKYLNMHVNISGNDPE